MIQIKTPQWGWIVALVVGLAFLAFWYFQPAPEKEIIEVPVEVPVRVEVPVVKKEFDTVYVEGPVREKPNTELLEKYKALQDENEKLKVFEEATRTRIYTETYSDEIQDISVFSQVNGELVEQSVSYETKPRIIETVVRDTIPVLVEPKRSLRIGVEAGVPTLQEQIGPVFKGNLMLENKKGLILTAGYDTEGRVWGGVIFKIF